MKISPKQLRYILLGLLTLVFIAFLTIAWIGLGKLTHQSQLLVKTKLEDTKVEAQLASLGQAKKQVEKYAFFNDVAKTVIPNDKDQAQAVLEIYQIAKESGVSIGSVTFANSTLGGRSGTVAAAPSGSTSPSRSGSASSAISQAKPVEGISGLYSVELTITPQTGAQVPPSQITTYSKFLGFISRLERNRRTAQITQINIQPQVEPEVEDAINFSLTINIFIKPQK